MKEEEDMESMKKGSPPSCRGPRGRPGETALWQAWGDRQSGSGREGGQQQESISEEKEGKRKREGGEEKENQTPGGLDHRESARPSEGREEFRGAVWGARQEREPWGQTAASDLPQKDL